MFRDRNAAGRAAATFLIVAGAVALYGPRRADGSELRRSRHLDQTFAPAGRPFRVLVVDNINGSIRVRPHDQDTVVLSAEETIVARTEERIERARSEVRLETSAEDGVVELFVDGPFRDRNDRHRFADTNSPGYQVIYDFELQVPRRLDLDLRTVNGGDVDVSGIDGDLEVRNVNGEIRLSDVSAAEHASASTVNGDLSVAFRRCPSDSASFRTVNGDIEVSCPEPMHADLYLKTMWGDLLSEFEFTPLSTRPDVEDTEGGGTRIRADRWSAVRVGGGGSRFELETLNGDVRIRRAR